jgi:hypothetical protein
MITQIHVLLFSLSLEVLSLYIFSLHFPLLSRISLKLGGLIIYSCQNIMSHDMLHLAELKTFFEVLHMIEFI